MKIHQSWTEFGEGRYPDCHYEGRQWPASLRELVLEGFADGMYLRQLYPVRSIETALSVNEGFKMANSTSKTCGNCKHWMKTAENEFEGVCTSKDSLASTLETVEAQFSCEQWSKAD